ncbi:hypothetical protein T06_189 [Trichinella sp. T6]|nr:hypothetical protein T06_189 [Trichinella sp. T6]
MNKRARKHHLGFYQFLKLILDEQGKTETVVRQIDNGYTHGRDSVRRSAAYGVQQRRVAALTCRLVRNEISVEHFLSAISYHTPEPLRLYLFCTYRREFLQSYGYQYLLLFVELEKVGLFTKNSTDNRNQASSYPNIKKLFDLIIDNHTNELNRTTCRTFTADMLL